MATAKKRKAPRLAIVTAVDAPPRIDGVRVGKVVAIEEGGRPRIELPGPRGGRPARTVPRLVDADVGREVVVSFEDGDPARPVVLGLLQPELSLEADGERVLVTAARELTLHCGKSSITLTRAGKILIRGEYVVSRSTGKNRILGGSIEIN